MSMVVRALIHSLAQFFHSFTWLNSNSIKVQIHFASEMKTNVNLSHFYRGRMARLHVIESTAFFFSSLINYTICIKFQFPWNATLIYICSRWWSEIRVNWLVVVMFEPTFQYITLTSPWLHYTVKVKEFTFWLYWVDMAYDDITKNEQTRKCQKLLLIMNVTMCWNIITIWSMS